MALMRDWRRLRTLVAVLIVVALAGAPSLDTLICCEHAAAVAQDHAGEGPADEAPTRGLDQHAHGHCHFGAAYVPGSCPKVTARDPGANAHRLLLSTGGALNLKFGLMRPPRA